MNNIHLYDTVSQTTSKNITKAYSTSFGVATLLFPSHIRAHIYNIYGFVRLADEIADTYRGPDAYKMLHDLEQETYAALQRRYSSNLCVHAFMLTSTSYAIDKDLIKPFFESMQTDTTGKKVYTQQQYKTYIYGSAEVVGLMCLKVFCKGNNDTYQSYMPAAKALGSAMQKINFLRDIADDTSQLNRVYFPNIKSGVITEQNKKDIIVDIRGDMAVAYKGIVALPPEARLAVLVAYCYYDALLKKLQKTPASILQSQRIRISNWRKTLLICTTIVRERIGIL